MKTVNMHEAKTNLSRLVRALSEGMEREIVISASGRPVAKLVPIAGPPERKLGTDRGLVVISPDFDSSNMEITSLFEGG